MIKLTHGFIAALVLAGVSVTLGSVNENDVHRMNRSVSNNFFSPVPGKLFEVSNGTSTPLCSFSNAQEAVEQDDPQQKRYTNVLGRSVPVAKLIGYLIPEWEFKPQVELNWDSYAEGLRINYRGVLEEDCEQMAQRAYERGSVVCVVDNVFRSSDDQSVIAVRFKHFAFAPETATGFPVCPLKTPENPFWTIRRNLISVAIVNDEAQQDEL